MFFESGLPTPGSVLRSFEFSENTLERDARLAGEISYLEPTPIEYLLGVALQAAIDAHLDDELCGHSYAVIGRQRRPENADVIHSYVVEFTPPKQTR